MTEAWRIRAYYTKQPSKGRQLGDLAIETCHVGDVSKEIELMAFHDRRDIAFVDVIDCHENSTVRMWRDGQGGWSPIRSSAW